MSWEADSKSLGTWECHLWHLCWTKVTFVDAGAVAVDCLVIFTETKCSKSEAMREGGSDLFYDWGAAVEFFFLCQLREENTEPEFKFLDWATPRAHESASWHPCELAGGHDHDWVRLQQKLSRKRVAKFSVCQALNFDDHTQYMVSLYTVQEARGPSA